MQTGIHFEDNMAYMCVIDDNHIVERDPEPVLGSWSKFLFQTVKQHSRDSYGVVMNSMTPEVVKEANELCRTLGIARTKLRLITKEQAVLGLAQAEENPLHRGKTAMFDFADGQLTYYEISKVREKIIVQETDYTEFIKDAKNDQDRDEAFLKVISRALAKGVTLTVYLCPGDYLGSWFHQSESIKVLCVGRRVFLGEHLFATGAAYLAGQDVFQKEKNAEIQASGMTNEKIGMIVHHHSQDMFCPIIQGGKPWFETRGEITVLVEGTSQLEFEIRNQSDIKLDTLRMDLEGIKKKSREPSKLQIILSYMSQSQCKITVKDLGIDPLIPTTNQVWQQVIELEKGEGRE